MYYLIWKLSLVVNNPSVAMDMAVFLHNTKLSWNLLISLHTEATVRFVMLFGVYTKMYLFKFLALLLTLEEGTTGDKKHKISKLISLRDLAVKFWTKFWLAYDLQKMKSSNNVQSCIFAGIAQSHLKHNCIILICIAIHNMLNEIQIELQNPSKRSEQGVREFFMKF